MDRVWSREGFAHTMEVREGQLLTRYEGCHLKLAPGTTIDSQAVMGTAREVVYCLTIEGAPRTKKNNGRRKYSFKQKRTFNVSSEAHEKWALAAAHQLRAMWRGKRPLDGDLQVKALVYREADWAGDLVGYMQAIGDVLEKATPRASETTRAMKGGVIENDQQIESWDGSRRLIDRERPRIELEIRAYREAGEVERTATFEP